MDSQTSDSQDARFLASSPRLHPLRYGLFEDLGSSGFTHQAAPLGSSLQSIAATLRAPLRGPVPIHDDLAAKHHTPLLPESRAHHTCKKRSLADILEELDVVRKRLRSLEEELVTTAREMGC